MIEALLARGDRVISVDEVNNYYDVSIKEENLARLSKLSGISFFLLLFYKVVKVVLQVSC